MHESGWHLIRSFLLSIDENPTGHLFIDDTAIPIELEDGFHLLMAVPGSDQHLATQMDGLATLLFQAGIIIQVQATVQHLPAVAAAHLESEDAVPGVVERICLSRSSANPWVIS